MTLAASARGIVAKATAAPMTIRPVGETDLSASVLSSGAAKPRYVRL